MFNWLKKRRLYEQEKLLFQNCCACAYILGCFEDDRFENNISLKFTKDFVSNVNAMEQANRRIASTTHDGELASLDDAEILLNINRELRRIYEFDILSPLKTFDQVNTPLEGWDEYLKREI